MAFLLEGCLSLQWRAGGLLQFTLFQMFHFYSSKKHFAHYTEPWLRVFLHAYACVYGGGGEAAFWSPPPSPLSIYKSCPILFNGSCVWPTIHQLSCQLVRLFALAHNSFSPLFSFWLFFSFFFDSPCGTVPSQVLRFHKKRRERERERRISFLEICSNNSKCCFVARSSYNYAGENQSLYFVTRL